jgi:hypothetical protein
MLIEWAVISAAIAPHVKKYIAEKAGKLAKDYADSQLSQLYKKVVTPEKLMKATESFVVGFDKELYSAADLPTLTIPAYREALKTFLSDPDVIEALETPLDGESTLDIDLLSRKWSYLLGGDRKPLIALPDDFDWDGLAARYCKSLQKQALADPELRQIVQARAALRTAQAVAVIAGPIKPFDLVRYAQTVRESFSHLRFGSLDADWAAYENRVHLENVYVPQSAKQALPPRDLTRDYLRELKERGVGVRDEQLQQQSEGYAELRAVPILEVVDDPTHNHLVVLGDPGLGKSTLLKYLALRWAQDPRRLLALLIELRRTVGESGEIDFLGYLERGAGQTLPLPRLELDAHLKNAGSLVLFDALDEVSEGHRSDVVLRIIAFSREYPRARIIVTTRIHGYHPGSCHPEQFRDAQFLQFTLQDFDPEEINQFVTTWHKEAFQKPDERLRYERRLSKALADSPAIKELACNPLLLTMMAILNRVQDLPRDRGRLYESCADLLLKNWDLEKFPELMELKDTRDIVDKLGPEQKTRILELVADAMQRERTGLAGNIIGEEKLKRIVEEQLTELGVAQSWAVADSLIAMLRERNFMLAYLGDRQYAFVHRTFLEYFCARDLKYRLQNTSDFTIDRLLDVFKECWRQDEWQEILALLCGMIGPEYAAKSISELLEHETAEGGYGAVILAARCLEEIRQLGSISDLRNRVHQGLFRLVAFDFPNKYDPNSQEATQVARVHRQAVSSLARGWKEDPATLQWLKERVALDQSESVRNAAVQAICNGWKEDPSTYAFLLECATKHNDENLRGLALSEMCVHWRNAADVPGFVQLRAANDPSERVRLMALALLVTTRKDDPDILPFLKGRALQEKDPTPRYFAMFAVLNGWGKVPEIAGWALENFKAEKEAELRSIYVRLIPNKCTNHAAQLEWLKDIAANDPDQNVRESALKELKKGWQHDPVVKIFLAERQAHEPADGAKQSEALEKAPKETT